MSKKGLHSVDIAIDCCKFISLLYTVGLDIYLMCMHDFITGLSFLSSSAKLYNNNKTSTKIPGNFIFLLMGV